MSFCGSLDLESQDLEDRHRFKVCTFKNVKEPQKWLTLRKHSKIYAILTEKAFINIKTFQYEYMMLKILMKAILRKTCCVIYLDESCLWVFLYLNRNVCVFFGLQNTNKPLSASSLFCVFQSFTHATQMK